MLLARSRRMPLLCHTEKQYRILENEDRAQQDERRRDTDETRLYGMAFHQCLGMPAETQRPPTDIRVLSQHIEIHISPRPETQTIRIPGRRLSHGRRERRRVWRVNILNSFFEKHSYFS